MKDRDYTPLDRHVDEMAAELQRLRDLLAAIELLADPTVERVGHDHAAARLREIHKAATRDGAP